MRTRSIVTSQPDVTCDVCERRLLRGEQSETFLASGVPRTVCELCAPRAAHEGWLRETDRHSVDMPPARPRRGRGLLDRLRQGGRSSEPEAREPVASSALEPESYEFLQASAATAHEPLNAPGDDGPRGAETPSPGAARSAPVKAGPPGSGAQPSQADDLLQHAIDQFNASEYPRRIAGLARSLGAPAVGVRPDEYLSNMATIVIAWDLCWYRYEVVLDEGLAETRLLAQGTELGELAQEDRLVNALADERGALSLSGS
jgi:hypothetical protein